jgi:hypothetical protein
MSSSEIKVFVIAPVREFTALSGQDYVMPWDVMSFLTPSSPNRL